MRMDCTFSALFLNIISNWPFLYFQGILSQLLAPLQVAFTCHKIIIVNIAKQSSYLWKFNEFLWKKINFEINFLIYVFFFIFILIKNILTFCNNSIMKHSRNTCIIYFCTFFHEIIISTQTALLGWNDTG